MIFIREGGAFLGASIAEHLVLPAFGLDLHYPLRRRIDGLALPLRASLWPFKELVYRFARPRLAPESLDALPEIRRAILVDDTASTGRTIRAAVEALEVHGIPRSSIRVAVLRCGERAKREVDVFLTDGRAWVRR